MRAKSPFFRWIEHQIHPNEESLIASSNLICLRCFVATPFDPLSSADLSYSSPLPAQRRGPTEALVSPGQDLDRIGTIPQHSTYPLVHGFSHKSYFSLWHDCLSMHLSLFFCRHSNTSRIIRWEAALISWLRVIFTWSRCTG